MAGLQRSEISFRRQGSSGLIWDDKFLSGELTQEHKNPKEENKEEGLGREHKKIPAIKTTVERSRSNGGGRGHRTGMVSPAVDPPSPKVSACGFCSAVGKQRKTERRKNITRRSK